MENLLKNTTALARAVCQNYIDAFRKSADKNGPLIAVDATCGNGHDALWLAEVCDRVYAFDIQPEAVKTTAELLGAHNRSVLQKSCGYEKPCTRKSCGNRI